MTNRIIEVTKENERELCAKRQSIAYPLNPYQALGKLESALDRLSDVLGDTDANPDLHRALILVVAELARMEESLQRFSPYLLEAMLRESLRMQAHKDELINQSVERQRRDCAKTGGEQP